MAQRLAPEDSLDATIFERQHLLYFPPLGSLLVLDHGRLVANCYIEQAN